MVQIKKPSYNQMNQIQLHILAKLENIFNNLKILKRVYYLLQILLFMELLVKIILM